MQKKFVADNYKVLITYYAGLLKYICSSYFGWDGVKDDKGRKILQYVGTDVIRKQNPNLWVDFVVQMLKYFHENWDYVIIPDCRFPNEISSIAENGFDTVHLRVERGNFISPLTKEQQKHLSETALDNFEPDFYINNDGTLDDLEAILTKLIKEQIYGIR